MHYTGHRSGQRALVWYSCSNVRTACCHASHADGRGRAMPAAAGASASCMRATTCSTARNTIFNTAAIKIGLNDQTYAWLAPVGAVRFVLFLTHTQQQKTGTCAESTARGTCRRADPFGRTSMRVGCIGRGCQPKPAQRVQSLPTLVRCLSPLFVLRRQGRKNASRPSSLPACTTSSTKLLKTMLQVCTRGKLWASLLRASLVPS